MLDVSQTSSLLQSLGINTSTADLAAQRTVQAANTYALNFLKELHDALEAVTASTASANATTPSIAITNNGPSTVSLASPSTPSSGTAAAVQQTVPSSNDPATTTQPPFGNFDEFRQWEQSLGNTFAPGYRPPDYLHVIGLALQGGDQDAFKRYVFFKDNPQYAYDYQAIRSGELSKFPTDGSTLIKTDLSQLQPEVADFYKKNPASLRAVEGFCMDPALYKMRLDGDTQGMDDPSWLMTHRWTTNGIIQSNNSYDSTLKPFIGLDGKGADNYKLATYSNGLLVDIDGHTYDPVTGEAKA